jgi:chitosanase
MITATQKTKILRIINVFETGSPDGKYDALVVFADGKNNTRQVTFGRSQTTEQGNLKALLEMYVSRNGVFSAQFRPFIAIIGKTPLADNLEFKNLLRKSAREDVIMRTCQDDFFDKLYYQPAQHFFEKNLLTEALSMLVVYDSYIHSGSIPAFLRERFAENIPLNGGNEHKWITQYVEARHNWLANHPKKILQKTIYRTQCFKDQIASGNWNLAGAINTNGVKID